MKALDLTIISIVLASTVSQTRPQQKNNKNPKLQNAAIYIFICDCAIAANFPNNLEPKSEIVLRKL
jgi:hypothetical protein